MLFRSCGTCDFDVVKNRVYGPKDYDEPVPGCAYTCTWTEEH